MAKGPVERAHPQQYLRLLLMRLLETQKCLKPLIERPEMSLVRRQFQENAYILSEIESWLKETPDISPLGPSLSSVPGAGSYGPGLSESTPMPSPDSISPTKPPSPFAWRTPKEVPRTESQVRSSMPSAVKLPDSAEISRGRVTFRPPFLSGKPPATSTGGQGDSND